MSTGGGSTFGAVRQAAMLAISGFMLMSSLAAIGSGHVSPDENRPTLESKAWQDSRAQLVRSDYGVDSATGAEEPSPTPDPREVREARWLTVLDVTPAQSDVTRRLSSRASTTSGCASSTRSSRSASTS